MWLAYNFQGPLAFPFLTWSPLFALMAVPDLQDAIDHLHQQDVDEAITVLKRKIEELPAHLTAHVLLARSYEAKEQWQQALRHWENACFLMPNSPVGQQGKARVLRRMKGEDAPAPEPPTPARAEDQDPGALEDAGSEEPQQPNGTDEKREDESGLFSAPDAPSDLEELRQQADQEAREGGARAGLSNAAASVSDRASAEDPSETPNDRVGELEDNDEEDLDRLIEQLESARIEPDPSLEGDVPAPDLEDDVNDLVSETLARIHEGQNQYRKAAQIYVKLASQEPENARTYLKKASEMREQAEANSTREDPE